MKELTQRQKQSIATKLKITQIATDLFKKKGFENVKIQEICDVAEISIGAFYHHFKSKSEIVNTGYKQVDLLVREKFESQIFNSNIDKILCLLSEGCDLLEDFGWIFVSDVYKNLFCIEGKYAFYPNRFITVEIKSAIELAIANNELQSNTIPESLTETLLRISRGVVFDWCLHKGTYNLKSQMIFDLNLIINNYKRPTI